MPAEVLTKRGRDRAQRILQVGPAQASADSVG